MSLRVVFAVLAGFIAVVVMLGADLLGVDPVRILAVGLLLAAVALVVKS